jgi:hypothetical protein
MTQIQIRLSLDGAEQLILYTIVFHYGIVVGASDFHEISILPT